MLRINDYNNDECSSLPTSGKGSFSRGTRRSRLGGRGYVCSKHFSIDRDHTTAANFRKREADVDARRASQNVHVFLGWTVNVNDGGSMRHRV